MNNSPEFGFNYTVVINIIESKSTIKAVSTVISVAVKAALKEMRVLLTNTCFIYHPTPFFFRIFKNRTYHRWGTQNLITRVVKIVKRDKRQSYERTICIRKILIFFREIICTALICIWKPRGLCVTSLSRLRPSRKHPAF